MEVVKLKTNIKCEGCLARISPALNEKFGEDNWEVDLKVLDKVLEVVGYPEDDVISTLQQAGFTGSRL
ncbi:MAG TPA: hypothetical protein VGE15_01395 [Sphingobacteriaceae bacterium]